MNPCLPGSVRRACKYIIVSAIAASLAAAVSLALILRPVQAAPPSATCSDTITVTNGNDLGTGSLRQAIADVCAGGTIYFDRDMTVTLASQLVVAKGLTIEGQEKRVTISGNRATRVFLIEGAYQGVYLNRLTIADGWSGDDNGGGIKNISASYLTLNSCLLRDNATAGSGGAIYDNAVLVVKNSTLTGNGAGYTGGAIFSDSQDASLLLYNDTITKNSATEAGGVSNSGAKRGAWVKNTIVAYQTTGKNCEMWSSTDSARNLSNTSSCSGGFTQSDAILLSSLGDYGGVTDSIPLLPGSAAIDAGANCVGDGFDQRGFPRVGACDIGAFESQGFTVAPVSGDNQTAMTMDAFPEALVVQVAPKQPNEPVNGGVVTFAAPASGASAVLSASTGTISGALASTTAAESVTHSAAADGALASMGGQASVTATANDTIGTYVVTAASAGASPASFTLSNTALTAVSLRNLRAMAGVPDIAGPLALTFGLTLAGLGLCVRRSAGRR